MSATAAAAAAPSASTNTRIPDARWPEAQLARLPSSLRPADGETLDLLFHRKVLLLQHRRAQLHGLPGVRLEDFVEDSGFTEVALPPGPICAPIPNRQRQPKPGPGRS